MVGGDPIGDQSAWDDAIYLWEKYVYVRIPAVISASEKGARAYKKAGFSIKNLGDEAIVDVANLDTNIPSIKHLVTTKRKVARAGIKIECRRLKSINETELDLIR